MPRTSFKDFECPVACAMETVGEWWTMLIIREALSGSRRFEEFHENLGIARNTLTRRLREMEENGLLERRLYQERPPRYEYELTDMGRELSVPMMALAQWGNRWKLGGDAKRTVKFSNVETGAPIEARVIDTKSNMPVPGDNVLVTLPDGARRGPGARR